MIESFQTVRRQGTFEHTERGSRFIGLCRPILTEEDAQALLDEARVLYPEARHYVYAWRTNEPSFLQRFSDDGEPRGTGGRQLLEVLLGRSIDRAALVVVRYFGGILLGTGGLSRAYALAAREALEDAQPVTFIRCETFLLQADYADFHQLEGRLAAAGFFQEPPEFGVGVRQVVGATADRIEELRQLVMSSSAGRAVLAASGLRWIEQGP